jgi:hypothetical protein
MTATIFLVEQNSLHNISFPFSLIEIKKKSSIVVSVDTSRSRYPAYCVLCGTRSRWATTVVVFGNAAQATGREEKLLTKRHIGHKGRIEKKRRQQAILIDEEAKNRARTNEVESIFLKNVGCARREQADVVHGPLLILRRRQRQR